MHKYEYDISLTEAMDSPTSQILLVLSAVSEVKLDPQFRRRWLLKERTQPCSDLDLAKLLATVVSNWELRSNATPYSLMSLASVTGSLRGH